MVFDKFFEGYVSLDFIIFWFQLGSVCSCQHCQPSLRNLLCVAAQGRGCCNRSRRTIKYGKFGLNESLLVKREPDPPGCSFGMVKDGELGADYSVADL
jgi:hypothetical protein